MNSLKSLILVKTKKTGTNLYKDINQSDYIEQWKTIDNSNVIKKSAASLLLKKIKDSIKLFFRKNNIFKNFYIKFEQIRLHDKNNFRSNKNLKKIKI